MLQSYWREINNTKGRSLVEKTIKMSLGFFVNNFAQSFMKWLKIEMNIFHHNDYIK